MNHASSIYTIACNIETCVAVRDMLWNSSAVLLSLSGGQRSKPIPGDVNDFCVRYVKNAFTRVASDAAE